VVRTICDVEKLGLDSVDDGIADFGVKLAREKQVLGLRQTGDS
jgi:hypothetical protein